MRRASRLRTRFALCIDNPGYPASLEPWKIYQVVSDRAAERHHQIRVIDESGQDYLYPKEFFRLVDLAPSLRRLWIVVSRSCRKKR